MTMRQMNQIQNIASVSRTIDNNAYRPPRQSSAPIKASQPTKKTASASIKRADKTADKTDKTDKTVKTADKKDTLIDDDVLNNLDVEKREQILRALREEHDNLKKRMSARFDELKNIENMNDYLTLVKKDYATQNTYIRELKQKQAAEMEKIMRGLNEIIVKGKLTDFDVKKAKMEQDAILNSLNAVRSEMREVMDENPSIAPIGIPDAEPEPETVDLDADIDNDYMDPPEMLEPPEQITQPPNNSYGDNMVYTPLPEEGSEPRGIEPANQLTPKEQYAQPPAPAPAKKENDVLDMLGLSKLRDSFKGLF